MDPIGLAVSTRPSAGIVGQTTGASSPIEARIEAIIKPGIARLAILGALLDVEVPDGLQAGATIRVSVQRVDDRLFFILTADEFEAAKNVTAGRIRQTPLAADPVGPNAVWRLASDPTIAARRFAADGAPERTLQEAATAQEPDPQRAVLIRIDDGQYVPVEQSSPPVVANANGAAQQSPSAVAVAGVYAFAVPGQAVQVLIKVEQEDEGSQPGAPSSESAPVLNVSFALAHTSFGTVLSKVSLCRGKVSVELQPESAAGAAGLAAARDELWGALRETMADIETIKVRPAAPAVS